MRHVRGLLLAAGAGRRMGGPKALLRIAPDEPTLVEQAVELLTAGGCDGVTVVVGAAADEVKVLVRSLGRDVDVARCPDWDEGIGASLRAGLASLAISTHEGEGVTEAVLVSLVDLPDLTPAVVARVLEPAPVGVAGFHRRARSSGGRPTAVGRATRLSSDVTTGRRSPARQPVTRARAATSAPTSTTSSSAATSQRVATPTPPAELGELGGPSSP